MTTAKGKRRVVPMGTLVYDHVTKTEHRRQTSYPVHVERVEGGRVYWFGDRARMFSCEESAVDLKRDVGARSPGRGRRE